MIRIGICDDNKVMRKVLETAIKKHARVFFENVETTLILNPLKLLNSPLINYDLLFLDIDMPKINGIDLARKLHELNNTIEIVFVTNHKSLIQKSFFGNPLYFIAKDDLQAGIHEAFLIFEKKLQHNKTYRLTDGQKHFIQINPHQILYFRSDGNYIEAIFENKQNYSVRNMLNTIEPELVCYGFVRIHVRYLINLAHCFQLEGSTIIMKDQTRLPVSRKYRKVLLDKMNAHLIGTPYEY